MHKIPEVAIIFLSQFSHSIPFFCKGGESSVLGCSITSVQEHRGSMIIQFTEAELQNLTIQPVERPQSSALYLEERECSWEAQMAQVLARNGHMWNGEIYTWENILIPVENRVIIRVGTCEYKDVVFRFLRGREYVSERYGDEALVRIMGVNVMPITSDGEFVFGQRADRPEQGAPVGGIGGTLNKDEIEIHTFADVRRHAFTELQEETALPVVLEDLRFFGLYAAGYTYNFWFVVRLAIDSSEIYHYHRPGEFSRLLAFSEQEARDYTLPTTPMFKRWLPYLHLLPGFMDGASF